MGFVINERNVLEKYIQEKGVTKAVVPDNVIRIDRNAFSNCRGLTSIFIPNSVEDVLLKLWACDELTEILVNADHPTLISQNGVLYSKDMTTLIRCPNGLDLETFVIPESVTRIESYAFRGCHLLTEIIIPKTNPIEYIGHHAFEGCRSLKRIQFSDHMRCVIGDYAFARCLSLEVFVVDHCVIGEHVFEHCTSLRKIVLGNHMSLSLYSFIDADHLEEIVVEPGRRSYKSEDGILYDCTKRTLLFCPPWKSGDVIIPEGVKRIGDPYYQGFSYCERLSSFFVPASVTHIWEGAFKRCPAKIIFENPDRVRYYRWNGEDCEIEYLTLEVNPKSIKAFLETLTYPIYHLDIERVDPLSENEKRYWWIPFQYSLHIEQADGSLEYREFLGKEGTDPRRALAEQLVNDIPMGVCSLPFNMGLVKKIIQNLAEIFPDLSEHLMDIHDNMHDLMIPFKDQDDYNAYLMGSAPIKCVLSALFPDDPELDYHNLDGVHNRLEASAAFAEMASHTPEKIAEIRRNLLQYSRLNTYAMVKVLRKLREIAET